MIHARLPALSVRLLGVRRGLTGAAVAVLVGTTVTIAPLIDGFLFGTATAQTSNGPGGGGAGGSGPGGGGGPGGAGPGGGDPDNGGPGGGPGAGPGGGAGQNTRTAPNRAAPANAPIDQAVTAPAMPTGNLVRPAQPNTAPREPVFSGNTEPASDPLSAEQEAQAIRSGWE